MSRLPQPLPAAVFAAVCLAAGVPAGNTPPIHDPPIRALTGHTGVVTCVAFSPDGLLLASGSTDGTVRLWNPATGETVRTLSGHQGAVRAVAFAPGGRMLASGGAVQAHGKVTGGEVRLWEVESGQQRRRLADIGSVNGLAYSSDGALLATAGQDGVRLWDPARADLKRTVTRRAALSVAFKPGAPILASGYPEGTAEIWKVTEEKAIRGVRPGGPVYALAFPPRFDGLVMSGRNGTVAQSPLSDGPEPGPLPGHLRSVLALAFSPDGALLAVGSGQTGQKGLLKLWSVADRKPLLTFRDGDAVTSAAFSPDGTLLALGSEDRTVRVLEIRPRLGAGG